MLAQMNGLPLSLVGDRWNEVFTNTLSTTAYAAFGDVIWRATDKLNLTFGLRYTRDEKELHLVQRAAQRSHVRCRAGCVPRCRHSADVPGDLPPEAAAQITCAL
ncbi:hypothetical protein [Pseudoxanthomonas mexicana]